MKSQRRDFVNYTFYIKITKAGNESSAYNIDYGTYIVDDLLWLIDRGCTMDGKLSIQERATIHTVVLPLRKLLRKCIENTSCYVEIAFMGSMVLRLF